MIRKATIADIDAVENSYTELLVYEKEHGSTSNWVLDLYPTRSVAEKSVKAGTLFVLEEDDEICASMIVNQSQGEEYKEGEWLYPAADEEVLVIHTLCIPPSKAGHGYGKAMVQFGLDYAKELDCTVIRLDTWAGNEPAFSLYKKFGFRSVGIVDTMFQGVIPEKLRLLEKKL